MRRSLVVVIDRRYALGRGAACLFGRCLLGLCGLLLLGCPQSGSPGGGSGGPAARNTIKIGHYGSLSGSEATFGKSTENGIQIAVDEINAAGGINGKTIEFISLDDKGDAREAGNVVTRLITNDGVTAIIGEVASKLSLAGAPVCQEHSIPMISPSSTNPDVTKVGDMIFRVCFIDPFQGPVCARFAREHIKAETAAILYDQATPYSVGLMEEFEKAFTKLGGKIVRKEAIQTGDQDFSSQLTQIRGSDPQVVFIPVYYAAISNIAQQARKLGIKVPLLGADGWESGELAKLAGDALEGCYYSSHYSQESDSPNIKEFLAKYQKKYNGEADSMAALGYDAAQILFEAMRRAPSLDGKDLAAVISQTREFDGVTGKITLNKDRDAVKAAVVLEIKGGKPTFVTTVEPDPQ